MKPKEERIKECGMRPIFVRGKNGIVFALPNYCHIRGCEKCDKYEAYSRKKQIQSALRNYDGPVFRAVVDDYAWKNMGKRLSEQNADYFSVIQDDGTRLVISSIDPYKRKDFGFVEISKLSAITELSQESNLFPELGNRSSGGNWRLTEEREQYSEEIYIYDFVPCFHSTEKLDKVTPQFLRDIFVDANTWNRGVVTLENAQEFANYSMNKAINLAEERGAKLYLDGCRLQPKKIGKERVDNWSVASMSITNLEVQGDGKIFTKTDYLLRLNVIEPHDYIGDYVNYLEDKKQDRLREELGDLYDYFYPEHEYNEAEQAELDKVVVY